MQIITGEARRRWSREEKLAAVAATFEPETTVASVARRIGANTGMLFSWRKQFRAELGFPAPVAKPGFAPVMLTGPETRPEPPLAEEPSTLSVIEVDLPGGVQVRVFGEVGPDLANAVIGALARR